MGKAETPTVRETLGVYADSESLEQAAERLVHAGFGEDRFTLLTTDSSVKAHLDHLFASVDGEDGPSFEPRRSGDDTTHGISRGLVFTGQTVVGGAVVASAAALGGPLVAALAGVAAVGSVGVAMTAIISQDDAADLQEHLNQGHLLLCTRVEDDAEERAAKEALKDHSLDVRTLEISANKG